MQAGAVSLARQWLQADRPAPDVLVATDMLDLPTFLGLTRQRTAHLPVLLYFHENQITYPWSPSDPDPQLHRDYTYGMINFRSALAADRIAFNSKYHHRGFLDALPEFLQRFPDHREESQAAALDRKSMVLPLGMDLTSLDQNSIRPKRVVGTILWNHRWEYDKNPDLFFSWLFRLQAEQVPFHLIVLGEAYQRRPAIFAEAREKLSDHILHFGFTPERSAYIDWLLQSDLLPVTSYQDFFGGSVVEGIFAGCYPILPNRLAYPEHIPDSEKASCLYTSDEEGYQKLKSALLNLNVVRRRTKDFSPHLMNYDWSRVGNKYDDLIEDMARILPAQP